MSPSTYYVPSWGPCWEHRDDADLAPGPRTSSGGGPKTGTRRGSVSMEGWQAEGVWVGGHVAWSTKGFTKDRAKNAGPKHGWIKGDQEKEGNQVSGLERAKAHT